MNRPNIIYIHSHDTGRCTAPYGYDVQTPNLQQFANEGVLFRHAFCAAPTCSPSRAALLTGQWAHCSGMLGLAHRGFRLHDVSQHLAHVLQNAGYHTVLAGLQHLAPAGEKSQLGYADCSGDVKTAEIIAANFLQNAPREPFFLDVGFFETHRVQDGFSQPDQTPGDGSGDARFVRSPTLLPDTPVIRQDIADYAVSAARLDQKIGVVLDALQAAGLADTTLVICTTDHGIAFPKSKCSLTDHGIGVLLLMRGPHGFDGGKVIDAMVSQIDLFPTVCELAGIDRPAHLQGVSLMPLVRGETNTVRSELFAEVTFHAAFEPKRAVRTERYKYIRAFSPQQTITLPNCDNSPSKTALLECGWAEGRVPTEALYDLLLDPMETINLAGDPKHEPTRQQLRSRLDTWMEETSDPLLFGPLLADNTVPTGVQTTPTNAVSPSDATVNWPDERARLARLLDLGAEKEAVL